MREVIEDIEETISEEVERVSIPTIQEIKPETYNADDWETVDKKKKKKPDKKE